MSVDAGLFLRLVNSKGSQAILEVLLASKWAQHEGGWHCIPETGDAGDWAFLNSNGKEDLKRLFQSKMKAGQVFGLTLWWEAGEVGGDFLIHANGDLTFIPGINRVTLGDRTSDVSWYLVRLLPLFTQQSGVMVESWAWRETA